MPPLCKDDVKDSMRATACFVHVGGSHRPARDIRKEQMGNRQNKHLTVITAKESTWIFLLETASLKLAKGR